MQAPNEPFSEDQALKQAIQRRFAEDAEISRPLDEAARSRVLSLFDAPPSLSISSTIDPTDPVPSTQRAPSHHRRPMLPALRYAALLIAGVGAFWIGRYQYHEYIEHRTIDRNVAVVHDLALDHIGQPSQSPQPPHQHAKVDAEPDELLYRIDPQLAGDPQSIARQTIDHPNAATPGQIAVIAQYQLDGQAVTLIQLPLATLVSIPDYPDYDQTIGQLRLVGKTMGDHMVCIVVASSTPQSDVDRLLGSVQPASVSQ